MKTKTIIIIVSLFATMLASCVSAVQTAFPAETSTLIPTAILTLTPTPTVMPTHTLTPNPKPATQLIAFSSNEQGNWDVYHINLDGTEKTQLTFDAVMNAFPIGLLMEVNWFIKSNKEIHGKL
jgi:hypothetical protein